MVPVFAGKIVIAHKYCISIIFNYPTGQNDSLELMFKKFATAINRKKLNPQKLVLSGAICLETTLKMCKVLYICDSNHQPSDIMSYIKFDTP